jgi:hypothetical protein
MWIKDLSRRKFGSTSAERTKVSYSFSVKAATKAEAIKLANEQFDSVVADQPVHEADMPAARETAAAFINLLRDDADCDCGASISGYISTGPEGIYQSSINISTGLNQPRKK